MIRKGRVPPKPRRQCVPRGNRVKRKSERQGDYNNLNKEEDMDSVETQATTAGLLNLPEEVVREILSYFSENDRVWKVGMTCRTLLQYSIFNVHEITMPAATEKKTVDLLKLMLQEDIFADWIRYVMFLGDHSKKMLQAAHDELPGKLKCCITQVAYKRALFPVTLVEKS